jgi:hypothetical protein
LGPNLAVVQTVLVVEDRLQVVGQRLGLVVDLVVQAVMDCLVARQDFDLDLVLVVQQLDPLALVVLQVPLVLVALVDQVQGYQDQYLLLLALLPVLETPMHS